MLNNVQNNIAFIPLIKFEQEYIIPVKIALSTYEGDTTLSFNYYTGRYYGILITYSSDDTVSINHNITS